ncbi:MAG: citrate synthase [Cyanobacteria bacterium SZAS-4]|nr:citrate synthase [Cyanobacteria bacterium SZAS-4]
MVDTAVISNGLDGIVVAETRISEVDGAKGKLIICGHDSEELAFNSTFEQTCALLWTTGGSEPASEAALEEKFGEGRLEAYELLKKNPFVLRQNHPMDALRSASSLMSSGTQIDWAEYARITAAQAVFAANWSRVHRGLELKSPDAGLSHSADFLRLLNDKTPSKADSDALDIYWTTISDHALNASTFTARVVASTESDNISAIVAAIGALKGPLHGGAPGPVLEMLNAIGKPENAESWIRNSIDSGKRIMGMGHRIYKVRDPRAAIFEKAIRQLEASGAPASRLSLARAVESQAEKILAEKHPDHPLKANVEFYTAVLLDAIHIPDHLFSSMFAAGRVGGWLAHIAEQRLHGRLIRPASRYTGPMPR